MGWTSRLRREKATSTTDQVKGRRREMKASTAAMQRFLTETRASSAASWEDRYTDNGVCRLEDLANGEDPRA